MSSKTNSHEFQKIRFSPTERMAILIGGDILLLIGAICIALRSWEWYHTQKFPNEVLPHMHGLWLLTIPWLLFSIICDSYASKNLRNIRLSIIQTLRITLFVCVLYVMTYFLAPKDTLPRFVIVVFGCVSCTALVLWRLLHFWLFTQKKFCYHLWVIGDIQGIEKTKEIIQVDNLYKITQTFDYSTVDFQTSIDSLSTGCIETEVDALVLATEQNPSAMMFAFLSKCREMGIPIIPWPILYETVMQRTPVLQMQSWYLAYLPMQDAEWGGFYPIGKRMLDIFCGSLGLIILFLLFPFLAIIIKVTSPGPLFFSQTRVGKNGRTFRLWKFRTMSENAENIGSMWTEKNDSRITPIGGILRKLHLDELPQLWNLFQGNISVVGVRPLSTSQCQIFQKEIPFHNLRHLVKPGLTGWAIVNYKHVNDLEGAKVRLEYDLYYVKHQSLWLDIRIIFRTVWTVITMNSL